MHASEDRAERTTHPMTYLGGDEEDAFHSGIAKTQAIYWACWSLLLRLAQGGLDCLVDPASVDPDLTVGDSACSHGSIPGVVHPKLHADVLPVLGQSVALVEG